MSHPVSEDVDDSNRGPLLLDACVAINLFATHQMRAIVEAQRVPVLVTDRTVSKEALWVGHGRRSDPDTDFEVVNLAPLIGDGTLEVASISGEAESELVVELARQMDDGEAECGAISRVRGLTIATDDRKAIKVFGRLVPPIPITRTSAILHRWERSGAVPRAVLTAALRDVRARARFHPPPDDPLYAWWIERAA